MIETQVAPHAEKTETTASKSKVLYDLYVLVNPSLGEADLSALQNKVTETLQKHGANVERSEKFKKRDLVYPVEKQQRAYEANIYFWTAASQIQEISTGLKMLDTNDILRYLLVKEEKRRPRKQRTNFGAQKYENTLKERGMPKVDANAKQEETEKQVIGVESKPAAIDKKGKDDKISIDDIDKKLDEIMGNL